MTLIQQFFPGVAPTALGRADGGRSAGVAGSLRLSFLVAMAAIMGFYLLPAEVVKAWFYRRD